MLTKTFPEVAQKEWLVDEIDPLRIVQKIKVLPYKWYVHKKYYLSVKISRIKLSGTVWYKWII